MTIKYIVIEAEDFAEDELFDREGLLSDLPFRKSGATVWGISSTDPAHPIELTAGIIEAGHAEARWTATEIRESVLSDYISLPLSREEQRANEDDARRHE